MAISARDENEAYHQSKQEQAEVGQAGELREHHEDLLRLSYNLTVGGFSFFCALEGVSAPACLFHPWKRERSPAFHASRSPGVLRSQSGRMSLVTARRSCHRSMTDGRPQNQ